MKILIGTTNHSKILGAQISFSKYFKDIDVEGIKVSSEVSDEPINEEILEGAKNRIKNLKAYARKNNIFVDYYIATEGGLCNTLGKWLNVNLAAVESKEGIFSMGIGPAYQVPEQYIPRIMSGEMKDFYKEIFSEKNNKELDSILTHDMYDRKKLIESAFDMALASQINGSIWQETPKLKIKQADGKNKI